jgi:hypothetical protein
MIQQTTVSAALEEGAEAWPCQRAVEQGRGCQAAAAGGAALLQELGLPSTAHGWPHLKAGIASLSC